MYIYKIHLLDGEWERKGSEGEEKKAGGVGEEVGEKGGEGDQEEGEGRQEVEGKKENTHYRFPPWIDGG